MMFLFFDKRRQIPAHLFSQSLSANMSCCGLTLVLLGLVGVCLARELTKYLVQCEERSPLLRSALLELDVIWETSSPIDRFFGFFLVVVGGFCGAAMLLPFELTKPVLSTGAGDGGTGASGTPPPSGKYLGPVYDNAETNFQSIYKPVVILWRRGHLSSNHLLRMTSDVRPQTICTTVRVKVKETDRLYMEVEK